MRQLIDEQYRLRMEIEWLKQEANGFRARKRAAEKRLTEVCRELYCSTELSGQAAAKEPEGREDCPDCEGKGWIYSPTASCPCCDGEGKV